MGSYLWSRIFGRLPPTDSETVRFLGKPEKGELDREVENSSFFVPAQKDLDEWLVYYNNERAHQGKMCCGRTPMETLVDGKKIWQEKLLN